jgi:hypothetical protein
MKRLLLLAAVALILVPAQALAATTRNVDNTNLSCSDVTGTPYCTIQAAVNASAAGDTVSVAAGTYAETVALDRSLTLSGAQATVDARGRSAPETIVSALRLQGGSADSTIDGFTFAGSGQQLASTSGPIDRVVIENNRFVVASGGTGVFLNDSGVDVTIARNSFDGGGVSSTLLHLDTDGFNGIWITDNWVKSSAGTGLFSDGSRNVNPSVNRAPKLEGNVFDANETGANLGRKSWTSASIAGNTFSNNVFPGLQGGMKDSSITGNTFEDNGRGGLELTGFGGAGDNTRGAQGNTITGNTFTGNGFLNAGEAIFFSSGQFPGTIGTNVVHTNNISGNEAGAVYSGTETINVECNWWGSFSGPSGDGPGSGDSVVGTTLDFTPWLTGAAPGGQCNGPLAAMGTKQLVRDNLAGFSTGDPATDKKIQEAVKHLDKSLAPSLWVDGSHLNLKDGGKVFDEEKAAVNQLMKIKSPPQEVTDAIDMLVAVDRDLAQTAIDDVVVPIAGNQGEIDKANAELAKANEEMAKAQTELDKGKPDNAIDHYKHAWEHARSAAEHASKA